MAESVKIHLPNTGSETEVSSSVILNYRRSYLRLVFGRATPLASGVGAKADLRRVEELHKCLEHLFVGRAGFKDASLAECECLSSFYCMCLASEFLAFQFGVFPCVEG